MIHRGAQLFVSRSLTGGARTRPNPFGLGKTSPVTNFTAAIRHAAPYSTGAEDDEDEDEDGKEKPGDPKAKRPFRRFKQKIHIHFLTAPHANKVDDEFLRIYYVLYFTMAFLMRSRRNGRYQEYFRKLRADKTAIAEHLPGQIGVQEIDQELVNLQKQKFEYLAKGASAGAAANLNGELTKLRSLMMEQAGNPEGNSITYTNLYQGLVLALHNYDNVTIMDKFRPGPAGLLIPTRPRRPYMQKIEPSYTQKMEHQPFLFKRKHVIMIDKPEVEDGLEGEEDEGVIPPKKVQYRVLGTFPNVMPRRQVAAYYDLYLKMKQEGSLPANLKDEPYKVMRSFYKHWISWTLSRHKDIAQGQQKLYSNTMQLATRMVRYHQAMVRGRLFHGFVGPKNQGELWEYKKGVMRFYENHLTKYTGFNDDVYRVLEDITKDSRPTPTELFDSIWRSVFQSKEGIVSWRMNDVRRKYIKEKLKPQIRREIFKGKALETTEREKRQLRQYYLIKTIMTMSMAGERPTKHPSQHLNRIQQRMLAVLYEQLLPVARQVHQAQRQTKRPNWSGVVRKAGQVRRELELTGAGPRPQVPKGEIVTKRNQQYPVNGMNAGQYLKDLQAYRRNHLLRTRSLALNVTPRGHGMSASASG